MNFWKESLSTKLSWKITFLVVVLLLGYFIGRSSSQSVPVGGIKNVKAEFINPTVTSSVNKHFIVNFKPLRDKYLAIQKNYKQKTYVYFAYLPNSSWVGLGEKDFFYAASTIKVPLAMSMYRSIENGLLELGTSYGLQDFNLNQDFGDLYKKGANTEFTVDELIKLMLEKSDNTAMLALSSISDSVGVEDPFLGVYQAMGWDTDLLNKNRDYININLKTLANMFLSLYNSTYVSLEHSNDILKHLTNSPFNDKIVAGVPVSVPVAHKVGMAQDIQTYSDCGIVYAPNRHYLLCIGSIGADERIASRFMEQISGATYQYVINN